MNVTTLSGALLLLAAAGLANAELTSADAPLMLAQVANPDQGQTSQLTPEQRAKLQAERDAKKRAAAQQKKPTFAERQAQAAKDSKKAPAGGNPEQGPSTQVTKEQRAQLQAERKAKAEANAKMTPEQKKAAAAARQKGFTEATKGEKAN